MTGIGDDVLGGSEGPHAAIARITAERDEARQSLGNLREAIAWTRAERDEAVEAVARAERFAQLAVRGWTCGMAERSQTVARLTAERDEAQHWRVRHARDAEAFGRSSAANWERAKEAMRARDELAAKLARAEDLLTVSHGEDVARLTAERDEARARITAELRAEAERRDALIDALGIPRSPAGWAVRREATHLRLAADWLAKRGT
jgi:hypothetical protein